MSQHFYGRYYNNGNWFYILDADLYVSDIVRRGEIYERHITDTLSQIECKNKTIIDCGANFGAHTLPFARLVGPEGRVVAFEAQRFVYYQLCANIFTNGVKNIDARCEAVAENSYGYISMIEDHDYVNARNQNIGNTHVSPSIKGNIPKRAIDDLNLTDVVAIKLDVQGYEMFVLYGAEKTILKYKPILFIEIEPEHLSIYGYSAEDVHDWLDGHGYKTELVKDYDFIARPV